MLPVRIFDFVLDALDGTLGAVQPEQGGALLGLRGQDVVTSFIHDPTARVTRVEYQNSQWLLDEITRREQSGAQRFKGIVHSHPARTPQPSHQDRHEFATALEANPELGRYIAPIVTHDGGSTLGPHELRPSPGVRISFFCGTFDGPRFTLERMRPIRIPLREAVERAGLPFLECSVEVLDDINGVSVPLPDALFGPGRHLFVTAHFPFAAPVLYTLDSLGGADVLALPWDLASAPVDRLARAFQSMLGTPNGAHAVPAPGTRQLNGTAMTPRAPESGGTPKEAAPEAAAAPTPGGHQPLTPDGHAERTAPAPAVSRAPAPAPSTLQASGTPAAPGPSPLPTRPAHRGVLRRAGGWFGLTGRASLGQALFARTGGLLSPALAHRHVLLVGAGSVGSYLADVLVRSGVGRMTVVDPDRVEAANIGRSLFTAHDIGSPKANATARHLRNVNPGIRSRAWKASVGDIKPKRWMKTLPHVDLIIAATDDNAAQQRLNHLAYWSGKPAVFVGLYQGAAGGEVVFTKPPLPCWACSTGGVRESLGNLGMRPDTDYGTGRSFAVPGLLPDIQHVASSGAKIALALLHDDAQDRITHFLAKPLAEHLPMVLMAMEPDHWFFPKVMENAPGQHAFQSIWVRTGRRPDCPVCGDEPRRVDPLEYGSTRDSATTEQMQQALRARRAVSSPGSR
ncbi:MULTISPECIES: ThiF family adenylyltransferase [unclassified Streptomyces]|uniref:ThiF family adenylyltransferase n=1 Tax=unclassified Streptomyces TaxID=2593676 RepID=UPI0004BEC044|nr:MULTISPECIES: ThiF family adenylyltransferase [unclassified Streptomyces]